jgi:hypothetical protein
VTRFARSSRRAVLAIVVGGIVGWLSSCSIPPDDQVTQIRPNELPPQLVNTTSTTTTTTVPTTLPSPSTTPEAPTVTSAPDTTAPPATIDVTVFYTIRNTETLQEFQQALAGPLGLAAIVGLLEDPLTDLGQFGLRTAVRPGLVDPAGLVFDPEQVTLTVDLDGSVFDAMNEQQKRSAIAQLVLTFTSNPIAGSGSIGFVRFTKDGEALSIINPATSNSTDAGEPVTYNDFRPMLDVTGTGGEGTPTATTTPGAPE